jgi:hypothetical protein
MLLQYPTTEQALTSAAENSSKAVIVEDARLPRAVISFYDPLHFGEMHFSTLGSSSNDIVSMDPDGNTFLFDGASRGLRVMPAPHAPKRASVSLTVGEGLYILERNPGSGEEDHSFEALIHHGASDGISDERWFWRSLPPPPYDPFVIRINAVSCNRWILQLFRQELASALASPDPTSTNDDDRPVTGPMAVKTNTGCEDEYCCCPRHERKDNTSPATPPPPPADPTPPRRGTTCPHNTPVGL